MIPRLSISTTEDNLNVETVLLTLGGYSTFQAWVNFAILVPEIPAAMVAMLPVFVGADYHSLKNVTAGHLTEYLNLSGTHQPSIFSQSLTHTSVVDEWNLRGNRAWITEMFTSVFMIGMMLGAFSASQMADRYGRRHIHFILVAMIATFGCTSAFVPNPIMYGIVRFIAGIGVGGYYCIYSIYLMEFLIPVYRVICGSLGLWFLGEMSLALASYFISSWRVLSFVTALPAAFLLLTYPFLPETPRWLLCHNKTDQAEKTFHTIARWNRKTPISRTVLDIVQKSVLSQEGSNSSRTENAVQSSLFILWTNSKLRIQLSIFILCFFSIAFTYYGISFNAKNLDGNPHLNMFYMGLVDMIAFPIGAVFSNRFGRKKVTSTFMLIALTFLSTLIILETFTTILQEHGSLITVLCFLSRFGVAAAWGVYICFAAESFPTVVRSTAVGICCLMANTGGVLAPQIAFVGTMWPVVPHIVFCAFTLLTVSLSWFLEEMNGKPLTDFATKTSFHPDIGN